ncbi:MAG: erythromycin esterase family protein [Asticcacaulis sp.]|nr:erythromycin esterase family protein [Asticcacaulis sp.]
MSRSLPALIARYATPLTGTDDDLDEIMVMADHARFVLIGEASHGTHDFYSLRAAVTRRLIAEKDFVAVAVEADWPDAFRVNRYVRGDLSLDTAEDALSDFKRFPQWMWRNTEVRNFAEWLYGYNHDSDAKRPAGFYGLDLYSLNSSVDAVIRYLESVDPDAAALARRRYGCFGAYGNDPQVYGYTASRRAENCEPQIIAQLRDLQQRTFDYLQKDGAPAGEAFFSAEQNARLVANAERYYRAMFRGRPNSWNIRDTHMADTLDELADFLTEKHGRPARIVVWAHNSHLGDARATDMKSRGELNLGQLVRERHPDESLIVGFSTYSGSVTAASDWDEPEQHMTVRKGLPDSVEQLMHATGRHDFVLNLRDHAELRLALSEPRPQRFIGVIYRPDTERLSHYFDVRLSETYDVLLHIDETRALEPLNPGRHWHKVVNREMDATYPTGL